MANDPYMQGSESITQDEHISPVKTGDNIAAKRVAPYAWNGTNWQRQGVNLQPNVDYDYIDVQQTSSVVETYVFKTGGSGGTTVRTVTVTYTDSSKGDLDKIEYA